MNGFEIISKIGEGAYSIVYKVKRILDNKIYALKKVKFSKLKEHEKKNALNEVRLLASIKSNFVISYKEAFFDDRESCLGIVMEYADNGDLSEKIKKLKTSSKFFDENEIWRIFIQLVKGLKALHDLKILHRDLKAANVFLFKDGSVKLGDLNVSKVAKNNLIYTQTGTPYYASPEVWNNKPYDMKSDIWSLGCVLYEILALHPPFKATNMDGLYRKVIKGQFERIPDKYSNDLSIITRLLIQVLPNHRPNCREILQLAIIKKRIEFFKAFAGEDLSEDQALLKTIPVPKNLTFLSDNLPEPNYEKEEDKNINKNKYNNNSNNNNKEYLRDSKELREFDIGNNKNSEENKGNILVKENQELNPLPLIQLNRIFPLVGNSTIEERPKFDDIMEDMQDDEKVKIGNRISLDPIESFEKRVITEANEENQRRVIGYKKEIGVMRNISLPPIKKVFLPIINKNSISINNNKYPSSRHYVNKRKENQPIKLIIGKNQIDPYKKYNPYLEQIKNNNSVNYSLGRINSQYQNNYYNNSNAPRYMIHNRQGNRNLSPLRKRLII